MDKIEQVPAFYFHHKDSFGKEVSMRFEAETWTEALSQFVKFLRGAGFILDDNSVGVNSNKHITDLSYTPSITTFQQ